MQNKIITSIGIAVLALSNAFAILQPAEMPKRTYEKPKSITLAGRIVITTDSDFVRINNKYGFYIKASSSEETVYVRGIGVSPTLENNAHICASGKSNENFIRSQFDPAQDKMSHQKILEMVKPYITKTDDIFDHPYPNLSFKRFSNGFVVMRSKYGACVLKFPSGGFVIRLTNGDFIDGNGKHYPNTTDPEISKFDIPKPTKFAYWNENYKIVVSNEEPDGDGEVFSGVVTSSERSVRQSSSRREPEPARTLYKIDVGPFSSPTFIK